MSSARSAPLLAAVGPGLADVSVGDGGHVLLAVWALGSQQWAWTLGPGRHVGAAALPCAAPQPSSCPRPALGPRGKHPDCSSGSVLRLPGASGHQVAAGSHSPRRHPVSLMCPQPKTHMAVWLHFGEEGSIQFSPVAQSCLTLCDSIDCSRPGLPVHHQLPEFTQTHAH